LFKPALYAPPSGMIVTCLWCSEEAAMGRIGRSYPRFEDPQPPLDYERREGISAYQVLGAIIGVLSALGLIGWLLSR
jgi:hypothetical protein